MTAGTARKRRPPQEDANTRPLRRAAGLILLFNGLLVALVLAKPVGDADACPRGQRGAVRWSAARTALVLRWATKAGVGARSHPSARRASSDQRAALAPVLLGLGILSGFLGQAIFTYYEWALGRPPPLPSIADVGYLSVYPFLLLGILLLPARPIPVAARTRIALDGLMTMTAAVTFSWYFVLGTCTQQGSETTLAKAVSISIPTGRHRADRLPDNPRVATRVSTLCCPP